MAVGKLAGRARTKGIYCIEDDAENLGGCRALPDPDIILFSFGPETNIASTAGGAIASRVFPENLLAAARTLHPEPVENAQARFAWWKDVLARPSWRLPLPPFPENRQPAAPIGITALDAALAACQLGKLDRIVHGRRQNALALADCFEGYGTLQDADGHIFTKCSLLLADGRLRDRFVNFLANRGIETECLGKPLHLRRLAGAHCPRSLPVVEEAWTRTVNIPVRPNLSGEDIKYITAVTNSFGEKVRNGC